MEWGGTGMQERWGISAITGMQDTCLLTWADNQ